MFATTITTIADAIGTAVPVVRKPSRVEKLTKNIARVASAILDVLVKRHALLQPQSSKAMAIVMTLTTTAVAIGTAAIVVRKPSRVDKLKSLTAQYASASIPSMLLLLQQKLLLQKLLLNVTRNAVLRNTVPTMFATTITTIADAIGTAVPVVRKPSRA